MIGPVPEPLEECVGTGFWIKRFVIVLAVAFAVIFAAQWLRGRGIDYAATHAALWAVVSALVFTGARYFQARRGQHCAICKDTPEMRDTRA